MGDDPAGLGAGRARTGSGGHYADPRRSRRLAGYGVRAGAAVFSCCTGHGIREDGAGRGRAEQTDGGADRGGQNWGAVLRGGTVSAERGTDAARGKSKVKGQRAKIK